MNMYRYLFCIAGLSLATCGGLRASAEKEGNLFSRPNEDSTPMSKKSVEEELLMEKPSILFSRAHKESWWFETIAMSRAVVPISFLAGCLVTGIVLRLFFWSAPAAQQEQQEEGGDVGTKG